MSGDILSGWILVPKIDSLHGRSSNDKIKGRVRIVSIFYWLRYLKSIYFCGKWYLFGYLLDTELILDTQH